jgi:hypothetical protein
LRSPSAALCDSPDETFSTHTTLRKVDQRSRLAVGGGTPYVLELDRSTPEGYEWLKLLGACLTQQAAGSNQALRGTTLGVIVTAVRHFLH